MEFTYSPSEEPQPSRRASETPRALRQVIKMKRREVKHLKKLLDDEEQKSSELSNEKQILSDLNRAHEKKIKDMQTIILELRTSQKSDTGNISELEAELEKLKKENESLRQATTHSELLTLENRKLENDLCDAKYEIQSLLEKIVHIQVDEIHSRTLQEQGENDHEQRVQLLELERETLKNELSQELNMLKIQNDFLMEQRAELQKKLVDSNSEKDDLLLEASGKAPLVAELDRTKKHLDKLLEDKTELEQKLTNEKSKLEEAQKSFELRDGVAKDNLQKLHCNLEEELKLKATLLQDLSGVKKELDFLSNRVIEFQAEKDRCEVESAAQISALIASSEATKMELDEEKHTSNKEKEDMQAKLEETREHFIQENERTQSDLLQQFEEEKNSVAAENATEIARLKDEHGSDTEKIKSIYFEELKSRDEGLRISHENESRCLLEIQQLKDLVNQAKTENDNFHRELSDSKDKLEEARNALETAETLWKDEMKKLEEETGLKLQMQKDWDTSKAELALVTNQLSEMKSMKASHEEGCTQQIGNLHKDLDASNKELEELRDVHVEMQEQFTQKQIELLKQADEERNSMAADQAREIVLFEEKIRALTSRLQEEIAAKSVLENVLSKTKSDLHSLRNQIKQLKADKINCEEVYRKFHLELKADIGALKENFNDMMDLRQSLSDALEISEAEKAHNEEQFAKEISILQENVQNEVAVRVQIEARQERLEREKKEMANEIELLQGQLKQQMEFAENQNNLLKQAEEERTGMATDKAREIVLFEEKIKALTSQLQEQIAAKSVLENVLSKTKRDLHSLSNQVKQLKADKIKCEEEYRKLHLELSADLDGITERFNERLNDLQQCVSDAFKTIKAEKAHNEEEFAKEISILQENLQNEVAVRLQVEACQEWLEREKKEMATEIERLQGQLKQQMKLAEKQNNLLKQADEERNRVARETVLLEERHCIANNERENLLLEQFGMQEGKVNEMNMQQVQLQKELMDSREEIINLKLKFTESQKGFDALNCQLAQHITANTDLQNDLTTMKTESDALSSQIKEIMADRMHCEEEYSMEIAKLKVELSAATKQWDELTTEKENLEQKLSDATNGLEMSATRKIEREEEYAKELCILASEKEETATQIELLQEQLKKQMEFAQSQSDLLKQANEERNHSAQDIVLVEEKHRTLNSQLEEQITANTILRNDLTKTNTELESPSYQMKQLTADGIRCDEEHVHAMVDLKDELDATKGKWDEVVMEKNNLEKRLSDATTALEISEAGKAHCEEEFRKEVCILQENLQKEINVRLQLEKCHERLEGEKYELASQIESVEEQLKKQMELAHNRSEKDETERTRAAIEKAEEIVLLEEKNRTTISDMNKIQEQLQKDLAESRDEIDNLGLKFTESQNSFESLNSRLEEQITAKTLLQEDLTKTKTELDSLGTQMKQLMADKEEVIKCMFTDKVHEIALLEEKHGTLTLQLEEETTAKTVLQKELTATRMELDSLSSQIKQLMADKVCVEECAHEIADLKVQLELARKKWDEVTSEKENLDQELVDVTRALEASEAEKAKEVSVSQENLQNEVNIRLQVEECKERLESEKKEMAIKNESLQEQLNHLREKMDEKCQELLCQSKSVAQGDENMKLLQEKLTKIIQTKEKQVDVLGNELEKCKVISKKQLASLHQQYAAEMKLLQTSVEEKGQYYGEVSRKLKLTTAELFNKDKENKELKEVVKKAKDLNTRYREQVDQLNEIIRGRLKENDTLRKTVEHLQKKNKLLEQQLDKSRSRSYDCILDQSDLLRTTISSYGTPVHKKRAPPVAMTSFTCAEEDGQFMESSKNLQDLMAGRCNETHDNRLLELQRRNTLVPPQLRSAYAVETQGLRRMTMTEKEMKSTPAKPPSPVLTRSMLAANKRKMTTCFQSPAPVTPTKRFKPKKEPSPETSTLRKRLRTPLKSIFPFNLTPRSKKNAATKLGKPR